MFHDEMPKRDAPENTRYVKINNKNIFFFFTKLNNNINLIPQHRIKWKFLPTNILAVNKE
jgi:hypothetical protein